MPCNGDGDFGYQMIQDFWRGLGWLLVAAVVVGAIVVVVEVASR